MPRETSGLMPTRIINSLKRLMKSRQITYRELGRRIRLSEASVKRIFSRATLTLARLDDICLSRGDQLGRCASNRMAKDHAASGSCR